MIIVGETLKSRKNYYNYHDICKDDIWVDCQKYLPRNYDLVELKTNMGKIFNGWRNGNKWDGRRMKPKDQITHWKRKVFEEVIH